jgi:hypothetical protein
MAAALYGSRALLLTTLASGSAMGLLATILAALALVLASIAIHYEALRKISDFIPHMKGPPRACIMVVIVGVFVAHLAGIALYAAGIALIEKLGLGGIVGDLEGNALDYFYLSMTNYTTLGVGDLHPTGALRILSSVEALNGFVLIGWSASFTYLEMQRFWDGQRRTMRR